MSPLNQTSAVEVQWAELKGATRASWTNLTQAKQELVFRLAFVKRFHGAQIFFDRPYQAAEISSRLIEFLRSLVGTADFDLLTGAELTARRIAERLQAEIRQPQKFAKLSFGADVAERDAQLFDYFLATTAFSRASAGSASVIIGPKGSGKTAILRALQANRGKRSTVVITPEVFANSMLKQVVENNSGLWDEDQAFASTWIYTILMEVFKALSADPKGVPSNTLKKLRAFLRDNIASADLDVFTRFVGYLRRIEAVKIGQYELTVKTRMLQEMYSLAPLYEIVPGLRGAGEDILILLDELDQGWDNSSHSNKFIASLLQAAIKIQGLGLKAHVIVFIRSEIFDLVKGQLDQLDKLRSSIEVIKWSDHDLASVVVRRVAYSLSFPEKTRGNDLQVINSLFGSDVQGMNGFLYLLSRTAPRPREVLQFVRHAHSIAVSYGLDTITAEVLFKAEEDFSSWKIEHICSEYKHIYPELKEFLWTFRSCGPVISDIEINVIIDAYISSVGEERPVWANVSKQEMLQVLYSIEFLGVPRPQPAKNRTGLVSLYEFAYERRSASIRSVSEFLIHPAYWSVLELPAS